eukprot:m.23878 g.23878  ORF g.23878 m.23878 type:complete len:147 (+) comp11444_c0_seq1:272-712(+)
MTAAIYSHPILAKRLLEARADLYVTDNTGCTALHHAAGAGCLDTFACLLRAGADMNARAKDGHTPLMRAARWCNDGRMLSYLVEAGADVTIDDRDGMTALHLTTLQGNSAEVEHLIKAGANVNATRMGKRRFQWLRIPALATTSRP